MPTAQPSYEVRHFPSKPRKSLSCFSYQDCNVFYILICEVNAIQPINKIFTLLKFTLTFFHPNGALRKGSASLRSKLYFFKFAKDAPPILPILMLTQRRHPLCRRFRSMISPLVDNYRVETGHTSCCAPPLLFPTCLQGSEEEKARFLFFWGGGILEKC